MTWLYSLSFYVSLLSAYLVGLIHNISKSFLGTTVQIYSFYQSGNTFKQDWTTLPGTSFRLNLGGYYSDSPGRMVPRLTAAA